MNTCLSPINDATLLSQDINVEDIFTLIKIVGRGEESFVYKALAKDNAVDYVVAVSISGVTAGFKKDILEIACKLSTLSQYTESFITIINWIVSNNRLIISMPLLDGTLGGLDLSDMSESHILEMFFEFIYGYLVAQTQYGFVHKDIHESNIGYKRVPHSRIYPIRGHYYEINSPYMLVFIDFGFSYFNATSLDKTIDKAMILTTFEESLNSSGYESDSLMNFIETLDNRSDNYEKELLSLLTPVDGITEGTTVHVYKSFLT